MNAPYHVVLPAPHSRPGRYLVGHATPGMRGSFTVDAACLTPGGAVACADALNTERGDYAACTAPPIPANKDTHA